MTAIRLAYSIGMKQSFCILKSDVYFSMSEKCFLGKCLSDKTSFIIVVDLVSWRKIIQLLLLRISRCSAVVVQSDLSFLPVVSNCLIPCWNLNYLASMCLLWKANFLFPLNFMFISAAFTILLIPKMKFVVHWLERTIDTCFILLMVVCIFKT